MNLSNDSCPIEDEPGSFPMRINLLNGSCLPGMSCKGGSCLIRDEPSVGQLPNQG